MWRTVWRGSGGGGSGRGARRGRGERPHVVSAGVGGAVGEPREGEVLLRAVEYRVQPGAELRERAGVARELAVDAVDGERDREQECAGHERTAAAEREHGRRDRAEQERDGRRLVRGHPAARREARDVFRVRADEEGREESVVGLHGRINREAVLIDRVEPVDRGARLIAGERAGEAEEAQVARGDRNAVAQQPDEDEPDDVLLYDA